MDAHRLMRAASRAWPLLALAVALSSVAIVSAAGGPEFVPAGERHDGGAFVPGEATPERIRELRVRGHVRGLYPGARKSFRVRVRNPGERQLVVSSIRTEVRAAGPGCGSENVRVPERSLDAVVPGRSAIRVRLRARMIPSAADACQDGRFPLAFSLTTRPGP